jgi:hypothetical protein
MESKGKSGITGGHATKRPVVLLLPMVCLAGLAMPTVLLAYQLHLPDADEGIVVALKRPASTRAKATLRLGGLGRDAWYEVTNLDNGHSGKLAASRLTDAGLEIELPRQPDSAIVRYRRLAVP